MHRARGWSSALNCDGEPREGVVFKAGPCDSQGRPAVATTICPSRLLSEDDGSVRHTLQWWLDETTFDGMSGAAGPPRWPYRGGYLKQPARLVEAVRTLRGEMASYLAMRSAEMQPKTRRKATR